VKAAERFFSDKTFQCFHTQGKFIQGQAALLVEGAFAEALQMSRFGIFRIWPSVAKILNGAIR
jgi:hypothetical protein